MIWGADMEKRINNIDKVLALKNNLKSNEKEFLSKYLENAPMWILDSFKIVNMKEGTVFIREKTEVDMVYILVEGTVKAIDYRILELHMII